MSSCLFSIDKSKRNKFYSHLLDCHSEALPPLVYQAIHPDTANQAKQISDDIRQSNRKQQKNVGLSDGTEAMQQVGVFGASNAGDVEASLYGMGAGIRDGIDADGLRYVDAGEDLIPRALFASKKKVRLSL
jgi:hypothetical protein